MNFLKIFDEFNINNSISNGERLSQKMMYNTLWEKYLPEVITIIYYDKNYNFIKGNVMLLGDLVEISYHPEKNEWGVPDTLEFDLYFFNDVSSNKSKIDIDMTFGDLVVSEFSIEAPNIVNIIEDTVNNNPFFSLHIDSIEKLVKFLNKFSGFRLTKYDLRFLDKYDNWK